MLRSLFLIALVALATPAHAGTVKPLLKAAIAVNARSARKLERAMTGVGLPKSVVTAPTKLVKEARVLAEDAKVLQISGEASTTSYYTRNKQVIELEPSAAGLTLDRRVGAGSSSNVVGGKRIYIDTDGGKATKVEMIDLDRPSPRERTLVRQGKQWHVTSEQRGKRIEYKIEDGRIVRR